MQIGANAGMFSPFQDFTPSEHARLNAVLDDIYDGFKQRVGDRAASSTPRQVEAVAKGRVWSGADAQGASLVDVLGGFGTALALAKQAAGIACRAKTSTLKLFPPPKSGIDRRCVSRFTGDNNDDDVDTVLPPRWIAAMRATEFSARRLLSPRRARSPCRRSRRADYRFSAGTKATQSRKSFS